jgi:HAD superfamily hydrolase (TIGR01509 family)
MIRPKVVLFDLGKVLVDFDFAIAARRVMARSRRPPERLQELIQTSPLLCRFERGELSNIQFFEEVRRAVDYQGGYEEFARSFADIFSEIPKMVRLHARVRAAGYPVWIFSNTNDLAVDHIRRHFPFFSEFDGYFLSYQLRVMKPAAGIYEAAERTTGCQGGEILYLDDHEPNVAAGAARGWQALRHTSPAETIPAVERILGLAPA